MLRILNIFVLLFCGALTASATAAELAWPATSAESKPFTRWWWLGNIATEDGLQKAMEAYAKAGLGGLELTPLYGVQGEEDKFISYLSPQWVERLEYVLKEGKRLGLVIDMNNGTGWPFGGPWVTPEDTCKYLAHKVYTAKAGEKLSEPVQMSEAGFVTPKSVSIAEIKEPFSATPNLQKLAIDNLKMPGALKLNTLMAFSDRGAEPLNLTDKVVADGTLDWTAPVDAGNWTLYAVFNGLHSRMVKRAAPGGEGHAPDHFSAPAIDDYLAKFDEALKGKPLDGLRALFCDSYEVDEGTAGEANFTPQFFEEFQHRRGYDLRTHLPALLSKEQSDEKRRLLCDYRETISDLLLENFANEWHDWAAGHGKIVRYQAHGSPGNVLDLYATAQIPETEGYGKPRNANDELKQQVAMMYASSAAHVTGKRLASSETCTWLDDHFLTTLGHAQQRINAHFLAGINHVVYHGTTYSPLDEAWPGFLFYAAVEFCPANSWWDDLPALNAYVARCQSFLQAGEPDNDVLLYAPFYDRWMEPGNGTMPHFTIGGSFPGQEAGIELAKNGISFDFVSDRQLASVSIADGVLHSGGVTYKAIVLPETKFVPLATLEKLFYLAQQGATIVVHKSLPNDVPGLGALEKRRAALVSMMKRLPATESLKDGMVDIRLGAGQIMVGPKLVELVGQAGIHGEGMVDGGLQYVRRRNGDNRVYLIVNRSDKAVDRWVLLHRAAKSAAIFDPMNGKVGLGAVKLGAGDCCEVYLQMAPGESRLVETFEKQPSGPEWAYLRSNGPAEAINGKWKVEFVKGGPELPAMVETGDLKSWTEWNGEAGKNFSGTAKYALQFAKPGRLDSSTAAVRLDLGEVGDSARVALNGKELGTLIAKPFAIDIPADKLHEQNTLEVLVSNLMANRIADMDRRKVNWKRFYNVNMAANDPQNRDSKKLFSAAKWEPRPSGLIGPVTMTAMKKIDPTELK